MCIEKLMEQETSIVVPNMIVLQEYSEVLGTAGDGLFQARRPWVRSSLFVRAHM
jgi:hypothetical protein